MESIVYAVDWNQFRENVFSGAAWLDGSGGGGAEVVEQLRKPTALVCSAKGAEKIGLAGGRKKRDDLLLDLIRTTVGTGGTVLIPTDSSGRVLELAYLLEHAWRRAFSDRGVESPLRNTKLYLASRTVGATMRYARSMLEWMDENVVREFEAEAIDASNKQNKRGDIKSNNNRDSEPVAKSTGPFDFRFLKLIERKKQIEKITSTKAARVIIASTSSFEWGFSRDILQRIAADPENLIILTEEYSVPKISQGPVDGIGATLWKWYQDKNAGAPVGNGSHGQDLVRVPPPGRKLEFKNAERVDLEGKELLIYQQYLATQRRLQNTLQSANGVHLETSADVLDDGSSTSSSSSEESDSEKQGKALNTSATAAHYNRNKAGLNKETLGVNVLLRQPGVYDYNVQGKKGRDQMFPYVSKRRRADDFGELIRPEDYLRAEEREETYGHDRADDGPGKQLRLGQKRKWEDFRVQSEPERRGVDSKRHRQQGSRTNNNTRANGTNGEASANGHGSDQGDELSEEEETETQDLPAGPSKVVFSSVSVPVHLKIAHVDFAGLHDQRSLSMLIPLIQPRKLVLIGGNASETASLANDIAPKLNSSSNHSNEKPLTVVFTPSNGQRIDASMDTNAWTLKLGDALARRLHWQNVRGLGVVTLMGLLTSTVKEEQTPADLVSRKRQKLLKREANELKLDEVSIASVKAPELTPVLDVLPANLAAATRSVAQPLHVGDLKLADLRKILQSAGHTAEFRGEGTLLVDGLVTVRKSATGVVEVEGTGLDTPDLRTRNTEGPFYAVKRKIYEGLALIAGG
jgi:cleavage and polyadenylation specificity factor subunit 2